LFETKIIESAKRAVFEVGWSDNRDSQPGPWTPTEAEKRLVRVKGAPRYTGKVEKMKSIQQEIQGFIEYFESQTAQINTVKPLLFRKILCAAALDPLARAAFGTNNGHHKRMIRLIDELTSWQEKDRVSLPQLALTLQDRRLHTALYDDILRRLNNWPEGHVLRLTESPLLTELMPLACPEEEPIVASARYAELFYTYRNNLIHEFREPGYGFEFSDDGDSPYYHGMINEPWQLVFSIGFISKLVSDAVTGLEKYLVAHQIDPYSQFEFGSLWRGR
jgi:hypothetical protein